MLTEEPAAFFDAEEFGTAATWGAATVMGMFAYPYEAAFGMIASENPQFLCAEADVAGMASGAVVAINAASYKVLQLKPDGTGFTVLELRKQ